MLAFCEDHYQTLVYIVNLFLTVTWESVQHYEAEESEHGWRSEEEISDETPTGCQSGGQEDLFCQLHWYM